MSEVRLEHHYVPRGYLKSWATEGKRIWTFRTLVSWGRVAEWQLQSLRGVAKHAHLYAQFAFGSATDEMERWLADEVDTPSARVLERVAAEERLRPCDWDALLKFYAASRVRTPAYLIRRRPEWEVQLPELLQATLKRAVERAELGQALASIAAESETNGPSIESPFEVRLRRTTDYGAGVLEAVALAGRRMWLLEIRRMVEHSYRALNKLSWSILRAPAGSAWLTSDDPAVVACVSENRVVTLGKVIPSQVRHLLLPLSPRHLLYARTGVRAATKYQAMEPALAEFAARCIVGNAHRLIFAACRAEWVSTIRERRVDAVAFANEAKEWARWHDEQSEAEVDLEEGRGWPRGAGAS